MSTFINSSTVLPDVPSLPPIQIPSTFRASADHHLPPLDEDSHLSPHVFTSFSPTHRHPMGSSNDAQTSPTNASPVSPNLRKSYSVDSFSRHPRPPPVSIVARQQKSSPVASPSDEQRRALPTRQPHTVDSLHVSYQARDPSFPLSGRSRGASLSTSGDEASQPIPEESDGEPVRDAPQTSTGARRAGPKFSGRLRPSLPPGELPLPSRLHGVNAATPANTDGSDDHTQWLPSIPPASVLLRNSKAGPSNRPSHEDIKDSETTGSIRKLGLDCGGSGLQSVSLVLLTQRTPSISTCIKVTIAVTGETGCGKSTAIMKGLKAYKLSEPVMTMDCPEDDALLQCGYTGLSNQTV